MKREAARNSRRQQAERHCLFRHRLQGHPASGYYLAATTSASTQSQTRQYTAGNRSRYPEHEDYWRTSIRTDCEVLATRSAALRVRVDRHNHRSAALQLVLSHLAAECSSLELRANVHRCSTATSAQPTREYSARQSMPKPSADWSVQIPRRVDLPSDRTASIPLARLNRTHWRRLSTA